MILLNKVIQGSKIEETRYYYFSSKTFNSKQHTHFNFHFKNAKKCGVKHLNIEEQLHTIDLPVATEDFVGAKSSGEFEDGVDVYDREVRLHDIGDNDRGRRKLR